jgi:hypothetical protein
MGLLEERLTNLWLREAAPVPRAEFIPEPEQVHNTMGVTFRAPTKISGTTLMPGRYVFQMTNPSSHPDQVEIFNGDHTQLIANIMIAGDNTRWDQRN